MSSDAGVVLVGCVKTQLGHPAPAEELFVSPLFRRRRHYAESSGLPWFVLSSRHGLLRPEDVAEPYDLPLARQPLAFRLAWGERVADQLGAALGPLAGAVFEAHAGAAHVEPLAAALGGRGAIVLAPLRGRTQGGHLAWYAAHARAAAPTGR
jgi:hypothetical protein